jgi:hypothetical protein
MRERSTEKVGRCDLHARTVERPAVAQEGPQLWRLACDNRATPRHTQPLSRNGVPFVLDGGLRSRSARILYGGGRDGKHPALTPRPSPGPPGRRRGTYEPPGGHRSLHHGDGPPSGLPPVDAGDRSGRAARQHILGGPPAVGPRAQGNPLPRPAPSGTRHLSPCRSWAGSPPGHPCWPRRWSKTSTPCLARSSATATCSP